MITLDDFQNGAILIWKKGSYSAMYRYEANTIQYIRNGNVSDRTIRYNPNEQIKEFKYWSICNKLLLKLYNIKC